MQVVPFYDARMFLWTESEQEMVIVSLDGSPWQSKDDQLSVRFPNLGEENGKLNCEIREVRSHRRC